MADPVDVCVRVLTLTEASDRLMLVSFEMLKALERRYAKALGADRLAQMRDGLITFVKTDRG